MQELTDIERRKIEGLRIILEQTYAIQKRCIEELEKLLGTPLTIFDYEGSMCQRPQGQGFPICPMGNPGDPSPHCIVRFQQMEGYRD